MTGNDTARTLISSVLRRKPTYIGHVPARLREGAFWRIQAAVIGIAALHSLIEAFGLLPDISLQHIPVALFVVPTAYAGYRYGLEGGLMTGAWCGLITVPNLVLWHRAHLAWLGSALNLTVVLGTGILLALPVERERRLRLMAERTSGQLAFLNEVAASLSHGRDLRASLDTIVDLLTGALGMCGACLALRMEVDRPLIQACRARTSEEHQRCTRAVTRQLAMGPMEHPAAGGEGVTVISLGTGSGAFGALGVLPPPERLLTAEDIAVLNGVAQQIAVAAENSHLQQQERERLRSYARLVTEAQEGERTRIARELHDDTAAGLVVLCRGFESIAEMAGLPSRRRRMPGIIRQAEELRQRTVVLLDGVRRFSYDLRPPLLDELGLVDAIDWLASDIAQRADLPVKLRVEGEPHRLDSAAELAVYRIVQEALHNVEKHAAATLVEVTLEFGPTGFVASVADNGSGFEPETAARPRRRGTTGLGLLGMQERAHLVAGTLTLRTAPGAGTVVTVELNGYSAAPGVRTAPIAQPRSSRTRQRTPATPHPAPCTQREADGEVGDPRATDGESHRLPVAD